MLHGSAALGKVDVQLLVFGVAFLVRAEHRHHGLVLHLLALQVLLLVLELGRGLVVHARHLVPFPDLLAVGTSVGVEEVAFY